MNHAKQTWELIKAAFSVDGYYHALNVSLKRLNGEYTMLHYPLYVSDNDSFFQAQKNLTDRCIAMMDSLEGKRVLEIGCGNGIQSIYLKLTYGIEHITGIDLNHANIHIAHTEKERRMITGIDFRQDNAQELRSVESNSLDYVVNIESAFHYPDKKAFLEQVHRVLKPGGQFVIADLLMKKPKGRFWRKFWENRISLKHWNELQYLEAIPQAGLSLKKTSDITTDVIKGFLLYPLWLKDMQKKNFIGDMMFRIFYRINLKLYIFLLRKKRLYMVFAGEKKVDDKTGQQNACAV
jgi:ubiquinone/menaquinone biosynthesis C-methylase UbiE